MTSISIFIDEAADPQSHSAYGPPQCFGLRPLAENKHSDEYGPIKKQKYFCFYAFTSRQNSRLTAPLGAPTSLKLFRPFRLGV